MEKDRTLANGEYDESIVLEGVYSVFPNARRIPLDDDAMFVIDTGMQYTGWEGENLIGEFNDPVEQRNMLLIFAAVVAVIFGIVGLGAGSRILASDDGKSDGESLVQCAEDEVWYPVDFKRVNNVDDLTCIHIDVIKEN